MSTGERLGQAVAPIAPEALVADAVCLREVAVDPTDPVGGIYWIEGRPRDHGRNMIVRLDPASRGKPSGAARGVDLFTPDSPWSARSTVHEYGGGAIAVHRGRVFFVNADQRIYVVEPGDDPVALTPPAPAGSVRFADLDVSGDGHRLVAVRERHHDRGGVVNDLVMLSTLGCEAAGSPELSVVAAGRDFYAAGRFAPHGDLSWLCWDHPNMPWDGTELWTATRGRVAGGPDEAISQPRWSPDGRLAWISDRSGWWNLYLEGEALAPEAAEYCGADWVFALRSYGFIPPATGAAPAIIATRTVAGRQDLVRIEAGQEPRTLALGFATYESVHVSDASVLALVGSTTDAAALVSIRLDDPPEVEVLTRSRTLSPPSSPAAQERASPPISIPERITFATSGGHRAYGLFYAPTGAAATLLPAPGAARATAAPPLIVTCHGGPTGAARPAYDIGVQFWTSHGFALVDVDYRGSTGYGRDYRRLLDGGWGQIDVDDVIAAAVHLADSGRVDPAAMVIRGRSAGGLTVLNALASSKVFAAGAVHYGVTDLASLATDTHKFESRYLDRLVGPWPQAADRYAERSPCCRAWAIESPVIFFHGRDDKVVPPSQAEAMVDALRSNGVECSLELFNGEGHGFRKADTIVAVAALELDFYRRLLGLDAIEERLK